MTDIEIIEFKTPTSVATSVYLSHIESDNLNEDQIRLAVDEHFSQWGLLHSIHLGKSDDVAGGGDFYGYVRFYSARAASKAKINNRGDVRLAGGQLRLRTGASSGRARPGGGGVALARAKCEELANFYLGFSGWSSEVLYHRSEDTGPAQLCYVTVVRLLFPGTGLDCEGAGKCEAAATGSKAEDYKVRMELAKRSKGEAVQAAWAKVVLVVVAGSRVSVEINTTKEDNFFYDPTWDEPEIEVNDIDYQDDCASSNEQLTE